MTRGRTGCRSTCAGVMRTRYQIDRYQQTYFVITDFAQLFAATRPDFAPIYRELDGLPALAPDALLPGERPLSPPKKKGPRLSTARV
jgi:phenylalanine-4-hydroxylase